MKRILIPILFAFSFCISVQSSPKANIYGDLNKYRYAYVMPTAPMTSSSGTSGYVSGNQYGVSGRVYGGETTTVTPSEVISGRLMKMGFSVLPKVQPEFADQTMIISYGYLGARNGDFFGYDLAVMVQVRDATTQKLVASYEAEGRGANESQDIYVAVDYAMDMFLFSLNPKVDLEYSTTGKGRIYLYFTNYTPFTIEDVDLRITYYKDCSPIHVQQSTIKAPMNPGYESQKSVRRDKPARRRGLDVKCEIISFKHNIL